MYKKPFNLSQGDSSWSHDTQDLVSASLWPNTTDIITTNWTKDVSLTQKCINQESINLTPIVTHLLRGPKKKTGIYRFGLHVNISRITIVAQRGIIMTKKIGYEAKSHFWWFPWFPIPTCSSHNLYGNHGEAIRSIFHYASFGKIGLMILSFRVRVERNLVF